MAQNNKELEKLAYEYQVLQAQAQILAQNLELLNLAKAEVQTVRETLENLKKIEEEKPEILVPIGAGSFLKGVIVDKNNAIVSVGSGYAVERSIDEAISFLEKRLKEYDEAIKKTQGALAELEKRIGEVARKAQEVQQKQSMTSFKVKK
ncbi:prefoldin subunit alpha [Pyrococcus horikoshii]|uniref:Prefoldin subunit alpha n=3 Tax=Pyrococcus horikoshii TaxID=53953 RepID=PFDA_PYRHO|nr:prefoldin subunit alpha [Pyrococcus horikoshii]O58263.2 RecName: Full=Prefoldin subunit alpha; AltName: Full=GimC subunit alpha [Pyrococcus horikoshii OT3]HII60903.1 prefoldin subunit alpha [Pyrococcus horikoshii]